MQAIRISSCAAILLWVSTASTGAYSRDVIADLSGPTWQLVQFRSSDDKILAPDDKAKYTLTLGAEGAVSVRIDCNRGKGKWRSPGPNQIEFGPLAMTRAACLPSPLNDRMVKNWQYVRSYTIKDGHLFLALMADGGIYEFEPQSSGAGASDKQRSSSSSSSSASGAQVKGTATYRERMALPPGAIFEAVLEEVGKADAPAHVIGRARIEKPGNPPFHFRIPYDPSSIDASHRYIVRARVISGGNLLFTSDQHNAVLTGSQGNEVNILLRRAGTSSATSGDSKSFTTLPATIPSTEPLEDNYWKLARLGDAPVTVAPHQKEPYLVLNSQTHRVNGSGGCNRLSGSYRLNGNDLTLSKTAGTMMACIQGMETERDFLQALPKVSKWRISGHNLDLLDASGNVIASFEARQMK